MSPKNKDTEARTQSAIDHPPESRRSVRDHDGNGEVAARSVDHNERALTQSESRISGRGAAALGWVTRMVPTVLVMSALAGLGWYGHHYDWKIPKFSTLIGRIEEESVAWCDEHGVAEAECIACNVDLMPKGEMFGWCKEHGVHECVLDHPETAHLQDTPEISQADFDRAARAIALRPRNKNDSGCKMHLRRIQFSSIDAIDRAGIDIGLVDRGRIVESVSASGEATYDPTRVARLASRAAGTVWRVDMYVGDRVKKGDVLAIVDAADVGREKAKLLQTIARLHLRDKAYERLAGLREGAVAGKLVLEAETARAEAEAEARGTVQALHNLGLPISFDVAYSMSNDELVEKLRFLGLPDSLAIDATRPTTNLIPVLAARDGIVVGRDVVAGEVIGTDRILFTIADNRVMWLILNVPLEDAHHIAIGQKIVFHPDGDDRLHVGKLTWISTDVDAETRTIRIRGELPNDDGRLRNETFGAGEILLREDDEAIVVPSSAVHWEGCCHVAFVRDKAYFTSPYKVFHTRSVRPGVVMDDTTEIIAGLLPGEVVVTKGSGVLRAELLKGDLGAG